MSAEIYALGDVERLFAQERQLMGLLQGADQQHLELAQRVAGGVKDAQEALAAAERAVEVHVKGKPPGRQWPASLEMPNPELCKITPPTESLVSLAELQRQIHRMEGEMRGVWPPAFTQLTQAFAAKMRSVNDKLCGDAAGVVGECLAARPPQPTAGVALIPQSLLLLIQQLSALGSKEDIAPISASIASCRTQLQSLVQRELHQVPFDHDATSQLKWAKVQAQTKVIDDLRRIVHAIEATEEENRGLRTVGDVRATAEQMSASMKEPHWRLKIQCEAALRAVQGSLRAMEAANTSDLAVFESRMDVSKQKLAANTERQDELWKQIRGLFQELGGLTLEKSGEVQWQIEAWEKECHRREEYNWGLEVAEEHMKLLQENITHRETALACVDAADEFIASGLDVASNYQDTSVRDLAAQKAALLAEVDRELSVLTAYTNEHRAFVQDCIVRSPGPAAAPPSATRTAALVAMDSAANAAVAPAASTPAAPESTATPVWPRPTPLS